MESVLDCADNSGAKKLRCIKVLGGSKRMIAGYGDLIKVSVAESIPNSKVKKGEVFTAVIVRLKSSIKRNDSSLINFGDNAVVLLDKSNDMIGTRVFGVVLRELRNRFPKIISTAEKVI